MADDYDDILNRTWDEIPEPVLLPDGAWLLRGTTAAFVKAKSEDQSHKVLFTLKAKEPVEVPKDLLEDLGDYDISINDLQHQIYIENASDWNNVRKFLNLLGVEMDPKAGIFDSNGKLSFAKAFRGAEVVAQTTQKNYTNAANEVVWQNALSKFQRVVA